MMKIDGSELLDKAVCVQCREMHQAIKLYVVSMMCIILSFLGVRIDFEQPEYSVNEENGTIEVCAVIMEGGLERNITITLATRNGTAIGKKAILYMHNALFI
jgi:hypothetical protein